MVRALAAAAVLHGAPGLLIEDNSKEEDQRSLGGWMEGEKKRSQDEEGSGVAPGGGAELTWRQLKPANR